MRSDDGIRRRRAPTPRRRGVTVEVRGVNQRFLDVRVRRRASTRRGRRAARARARRASSAAGSRSRVDADAAGGAAALPRRRCATSWRARYVDAARGARRAGSALAGRGRRSPTCSGCPSCSRCAERAARPRAASCRRCAARSPPRCAPSTRERRREGAHLQRDMHRRAAPRCDALGAPDPRAALPAVQRGAPRPASRSAWRASPAGATSTPARVAQEVGALAERSDVTEELVRLDSHLGALAARAARRRAGRQARSSSCSRRSSASSTRPAPRRPTSRSTRLGARGQGRGGEAPRAGAERRVTAAWCRC